MNSHKRIYSLVSLGIVIVMLLTAVPVSAATITSRASATWGTSGTNEVHGVYAYDVDGDSTMEIVTVGRAYTGIKTEASLVIWTYDGNSTLTAEHWYNWTEAPLATVTVAYDVFVDDLNQDGTADIVVGGTTGNASIGDYMLRVFHWDGTSLTSEGPPYVNSPAEIYYSVHAANVTGDSDLEIVASGATGGGDDATLWLWSYNGSLGYITHTDWGPGDNVEAIAYGVFAGDVDGDGTVEVVTGGYNKSSAIAEKKGEIREWHYDSGSGFVLDYHRNDNYVPGEDTVYYSTYAADFNNNGSVDIMMCGYGYEAGIVNEDKALLVAYFHGTSSLLLGPIQPWQVNNDDSYCRSVFGRNLDGDNYIEIVTGGRGEVSGTVNAEVRVWTYDTAPSFSLDDDEYWYTTGATRSNSVYAMDIAGDSDPEIVSGGRHHVSASTYKAELEVFEFS